MIHLPNVSVHSRPPRCLQSPFALGHTFSEHPGEHERQKQGVLRLLDFAIHGGAEVIQQWEV